MNMRIAFSCFLLLIPVLCWSQNRAQLKAGQVLVNGNASFFSGHSVNDGSTFPLVIDGMSVPAFTYERKQDYYNTTLAPKAHYFLNERWSMGLGFGWRYLVNKRHIPSISATETPVNIAFSPTTRFISTIHSYSPRVEVIRHWSVGKRCVLMLGSFAGWQFEIHKQEQSAPLQVITVADLTGWDVSNNGLQFTPVDQPLTTTRDKEKTWFAGIFPQIRYAITPRFGASAVVGGLIMSQRYDSTQPDFNRAAPDLTLNFNPTTWTFGLFYVFGKGDESAEN